MRKLVPILVCLFVASLAWLGFTTYTRYQAENWDGKMPAGMDFIGTWHIESRTTDGHELAGEDLQKVRDHGFDSFIVLNLDATAELNLYGNVFKGAWLAEGENKATIYTDEITKALQLVNGKVVMGDEYDHFVFAPSTPEEYEAYLNWQPPEDAEEVDEEFVEYWGLDDYDSTSEESGEAESEETGEPATEETPVVEPNEWGIYPMDVTIAHDALVTIKVTGKSVDHLGCSGYYLALTNNSDTAFTITRALDSFTVNGKAATPVLHENLEPGQTVDVFMWWDAADVKVLDELVNVQGILEVDELNGFNAYGTYNFLME